MEKVMIFTGIKHEEALKAKNLAALNPHRTNLSDIFANAKFQIPNSSF